MDAEDVLRYLIAHKYDTAATFIYIDLPYLFSTRKGQRPVYRFEADEFKHIAVIKATRALKHARVMFSHYPNDLYDEMLAGWQTFNFMSTTRKGQVLERIYYNYELTDQLHDYSYIGEDFREREALSRVKKNFIRKLKRLDPQLRNAILQDLTSQKNALLANIGKKCDDALNGYSVDFIYVDEARHLVSSQNKEV
ncbi:hypothetical protein ACRQ5D_10775 [Mucilaginibacter sp. P25]|uniref:hypothetical protein n=1 Tax=Mucilaginibacter sp. P25 TaxID=3423945 RepID=UPI003D78FD1B